ncbi:hypothetical protein J6590_079253 [Homalodisca vitripennis]|nr:hypothetical protein J6590_079253 [Homalodisca vitripennis]
MVTVGRCRTSVPRWLLWVTAGPVYHDCTVGYGRTSVPQMQLWVMAGPVYLTTVGHSRTCVPGWPMTCVPGWPLWVWQDLCTRMATVSHGRRGVLRWKLWVVAESMYLTSVGHFRTFVPGWPLWVIVGAVYYDGSW